MTAAFQTEGLTRRYGSRVAVNGLDLAVEAGSIFGLLGPNGAGKTTTLAMALRLVRPDAGRALINGVDVWREPRRALAQVGALIEAPAFYPYLSGFENLLVLARHAGLPAADIPRVLAELGLAERARDKIGGWSQGMRQRLGIAAALLGDPPLLILDEPTVGLDPLATVELRATLRDLAAAGKTIIFSSHQLAEVQHVCDHVAVIKDGRAVAQGAVGELLGSGGRLLLRVEGGADERERALGLARQWNGGTKGRIIEEQLDLLLPAEQAAGLNRFLVEQGVAVAELRPASPSLEDFFLALTATEERR
ncbi:MAG TPA: ATP-binding cassette domain-containing protein [Herpetosiphonaceae bacterium]